MRNIFNIGKYWIDVDRIISISDIRIHDFYSHSFEIQYEFIDTPVSYKCPDNELDEFEKQRCELFELWKLTKSK